jgi:hypothetical protein
MKWPDECNCAHRNVVLRTNSTALSRQVGFIKLRKKLIWPQMNHTWPADRPPWKMKPHVAPLSRNQRLAKCFQNNADKTKIKNFRFAFYQRLSAFIGGQ